METGREPAAWRNIPVLASTLVQMQLLLDVPCHLDDEAETSFGCPSHPCLDNRVIDLAAVSALILTDVGATLQILRLCGREFDFAEDRPRSIEHCIASLNTETWIGAIFAEPFTHEANYALAVSLWEHSRTIAGIARQIAFSMPGVNPAEAYLAGLLHDLGKLPAVLGWSGIGDLEAADLAEQWSLPLFTIDMLEGGTGRKDTGEFRDTLSAGMAGTSAGLAGGLASGLGGGMAPQVTRPEPPWAAILSAAHQIASRPSSADSAHNLPAAANRVSSRGKQHVRPAALQESVRPRLLDELLAGIARLAERPGTWTQCRRSKGPELIH
ncbi:MAG TPA: HDOD domain-containing protein [Acidisarcina sp.]